MIKACLLVSLKYSPIAHPEYGTKNYRGAASEAVAAIIIVYLSASCFFNSLYILATVDLFYPIATYIQYNLSLSILLSFIYFWLIIVSIAMVVFPVYLSPIINSL